MRRTGCAALLTCLSLLGSLLLTAAPAAAGTTVEGVVRHLIADAAPGNDRVRDPDREERVLVTDSGETYFLRGASTPINRQVSVTGKVTGDLLEVTSADVTQAVAGVPPSGTTRVLVMLAYWTAPDSVTQRHANDVFFNQSNAWYRDASYGAVGQAGDATPWLRIAGPSGGCYSDHASIMNQAKEAAAAAGYDLASYDNYAVYFPHCGADDDAVGYAGWAYVASPDLWLNGYLDRRVVTHEQGHNYGLWHSHSQICDGGGLLGSCTFTDYGDPYDAMGSSTYVGHFSAPQKSLLRWLGGGRTVDLSRGGATTLAPLADDGAGPHAAVVSVPGSTRRYWVEYRQGIDSDAGLPSSGTDGVLVHVTGDGSGSADTGSSLLDVTPGDGVSTDSATLKAGSSWVTPEGFVISAGALSGAGAEVTVRTSGATVPGAPLIEPATGGATGGAVSATAAWSAPRSTGGAPITGYRVRAVQLGADGSVVAVTVSAIQPATARTLAMTLPAVGDYRFVVRAFNAVGVGAPSARSNVVAGR